MSEKVGLDTSSDETIGRPPGFEDHVMNRDNDDHDDDSGGGGGGDDRGRTTTTGTQGGGEQSATKGATRYNVSYENDYYRPLSSFTCEATFTHVTQDENHGSRRAGYGAREKWGKKVMDSLTDDFGSMSITTEQSLNGYRVPNWSDGRYEDYHHGIPYSSSQHPLCYPVEQQIFYDDQPAQPQVYYSGFPPFQYLHSIS